MEVTTEREPTTIGKQTTDKPWLFKPGNQMNPNGRPRGTANKLSVKTLLAQLSDTIGTSYEQQLAENYRDAIVAGDRKVIYAYDNLFMNKLLADKVALEIGESEEIMDSKRVAFLAALSHYGQQVLDEAVTTATVVDATWSPSDVTVTHDTGVTPNNE